MIPRINNDRGADLFVGTVVGGLCGIPWTLAVVGWASHWNIYYNLSFMLVGICLWLSLWKSVNLIAEDPKLTTAISQC